MPDHSATEIRHAEPVQRPDPRDVDVADLESVISTAELSRRATRPPDHASENRALVALVEAMTASPDDILQYLVQSALELCRAGSAGISLLDAERRRFRWAAVAGEWAPHLGGGTPREFGPCGTVLDRDAALLFTHPEHHFNYLGFVRPLIEELLLIPFHVGGQAVGTIWIIAHDPNRRFDAEDLRVMTDLAHFAAAAYAARIREVAARVDVSGALATEGSLRGKLQGCAEAIVRHLDAAVARVWVTRKDPRVLELQASAGASAALGDAQTDVLVGRGDIGRIAQERTPHVTNDAANDPRLDDPHWAPAEGMTAFAGYPLLAGGTVVGVLALYGRKPISQATVETLASIADTVAQGVQRARGEAALRRSEAFLAEAQRLSSTGSFSWRAATDDITWSEQVYRICQIDRARPVTWDVLAALLHPDDRPVFDERTELARREGQDFELEHRVLLPDGSTKHLHVVAHAMRDRDGQLEYIGAVQDVTQRRLSEEALSKVRADLAHVARVTSLGTLTASIAHELAQPLSGIMTNASTCLRLLAPEPPDLEGARDTARRTIRDANRASEVITRLRALYRKKEKTTESVDLNEATREVVALSLTELRTNAIVVRMDLASDLPPVNGDRVQLQQVILNLVLNAADAMSGVGDRPKRLTLTTAREELDAVRLTVQDVGVGIDPATVDALFEPFYTTKSGGMGIGLSVSRSIIESHRGRLWATPNEGPGASFSFAIPCKPEA